MVKTIVIVGGGSAGWMTAATLSAQLQGVKIKLIESSDIPIIGVGESTIVPMVDYMQNLGLQESDWMGEVNATYKSAIRFNDFYEKGHGFYYTFEPMRDVEGRPINRYWHNRYLSDPDNVDRMSFFDYCFVTPDILRQGSTIRSVMSAGPSYHVDAGLLGDFLSRYACQRGVERIIDTIDEVTLDERGDISGLRRSSGETLDADLYIDCTGFRSMLLGQALNEPFDEYYDYLFNNKAVAMRFDYEDPRSEMLSYTNCTAQSAGWIWEVPLFTRRGSGYVYCDRYVSADEAEAEFRRHLGTDRVKDVDARHIDIRVGKHRNVWSRNCVAIGLAAGFMEPLESTGLFAVQLQAETLARMLANGRNDYNVGDVTMYNTIVTEFFENVRDFLCAHYMLTSREDTPYWRDVKYGMKVSDRLAEILRYARLTFVDAPIIRQMFRANFADYSFTDGWEAVLIGMNHMPFDFGQFKGGVGPFEPAIADNVSKARIFQQEMMAYKQNELAKLPSHYDYLAGGVHQKSGAA
ncbi:MAG: tryptophan halogenase family protein [Pseudomonadota bacterium]